MRLGLGDLLAGALHGLAAPIRGQGLDARLGLALDLRRFLGRPLELHVRFCFRRAANLGSRGGGVRANLGTGGLGGLENGDDALADARVVVLADRIRSVLLGWRLRVRSEQR